MIVCHLKSKKRRKKMETKLPVKSRVADKYQPMLTYYAELIGLCHETVAKTQSLQMLDPMGKKTTATSLFIRVCQRMDKSIDAKEVAEKLETISKTNEQRSHVA
jgi:hypothetical protein|tara:strand:+ start:333 stop:644 length:312 start_codon:yes stop_codon:yes gene_type:complete